MQLKPTLKYPGSTERTLKPRNLVRKEALLKTGDQFCLRSGFHFLYPKTESNSCRVISEFAKQGFCLPQILSVPNMRTSSLLKLLLSQFNLKNRKYANWYGGARVGRGKLNFYSRSLIHLEKESHMPSFGICGHCTEKCPPSRSQELLSHYFTLDTRNCCFAHPAL